MTRANIQDRTAVEERTRARGPGMAEAVVFAVPHMKCEDQVRKMIMNSRRQSAEEEEEEITEVRCMNELVGENSRWMGCDQVSRSLGGEWRV